MPNDSSIFKVPAFERNEGYDFDTTKKSLSVFEELNAIAEEIERCRAENL